MSLSVVSEIEGIGGGDYQRIYVPTRLSSDSQNPFDAGDRVRLQLVPTSCGRNVIVLTNDLLEIDAESTVLLTETETKQTRLEEGAENE